MRRVATVAATKLTAKLPDSRFIRELGTPEVTQAPPQTASLHAEPLGKGSICENKAFFSTKRRLENRQSLKKDGGEMLVALVLDKPLAAVKALVDNSPALIDEIMRTIENKKPVRPLAQGCIGSNPAGLAILI